MNLEPIIITGLCLSIPAATILLGMRMDYKHNELKAGLRKEKPENSATPRDNWR